MLSIRTSDDWSAATVTFDDGGGPVAINIGADSRSAYDAMTQIVDEAAVNHGGSWSWSWAAQSDRGALITITAGVAVSATFNAAAQSLLGFSASYGSGTTIAAASSAKGTLDPAVQLSVRGAWGTLPGDETAGGTGALRMGSPGVSMFALKVATALDAVGTGRLQSVLDAARNPRQGWLYQEHIGGGTWRLAALGEFALSHNRRANLWGLTVDAIGGLVDG